MFLGMKEVKRGETEQEAELHFRASEWRKQGENKGFVGDCSSGGLCWTVALPLQ